MTQTSSPILRPLRYAIRVPLLLWHLLIDLPLTLLFMTPFTRGWRIGNESVRYRMIRAWSAGMMQVFGFRLRRYGTPQPGAALFVAKSEISRWPLIGWMARRGGTIYHRRGNTESLAGVLHMMVERLQSGQAVGVFPEGGTTPGDALGTFHARIFQAAVAADVPVQPVALRYGEGGNAQTVIAFGPNENFMQNFLRVLGEPSRQAEVHFLEPMLPGPDGRRRLADACRERIQAAMVS